jgi:hypothetical protein
VSTPIKLIAQAIPYKSPGAEVAAFREYLSSADRGYHCARDDRANARHCHQPLAGLILMGDCFGLARQTLDTLIQPTPVFRQPLDDAQHTRREYIRTYRQDTRQLGPQGTRALPHGDAPLQQERTDLIDDAGTLTDQSIADAVQRLKVELIGGLVATNFMVGRWPASAMASASRKSFFCPFEYGRKYFAGIRRASWPSIWSLRLR